MNEKTVVITELDGKYRLQNNGISEFALLGILECIVFDLKSAKRAAAPEADLETKSVDAQSSVDETVPARAKGSVPESNAPELKTRIANAIKAIKALGGQTPDFDSSGASDEELRDELEALTEQYKRLKSSKSPGK